MQQPDIDKLDLTYGNEIDIKAIFSALWSGRYIIILCTFASFALAALIAINTPNIYKSSALLAPTSADESLSSKLSSYSAFAGLAGVSVPSGEITMAQEGVVRIKSFGFFSKHFLPNIKLENLIAVKKWSYSDNRLVYKDNIFDIQNNTWVRKFTYPQKQVPSHQEAYEQYKKILSVSQDKKTSFINISIKHHSPYIAKQWLDMIIKNINETMKEEDKKNASRTIDYLNATSQTTNFQSIKDAISSLLEDQMQTLMLASSNEYYVFKVIDAPVVSEKKAEPSRFLICLYGVLIGFAISSIWALFFFFEKRS